MELSAQRDIDLALRLRNRICHEVWTPRPKDARRAVKTLADLVTTPPLPKTKSPRRRSPAGRDGAPKRSRTTNLLIRSQMLYPIELWVHESELFEMAETEGFEPSVRFPVRTLSKRVPSATRSRLRRMLEWRWWDSNPRPPCEGGGFQDRCLQPLGHTSEAARPPLNSTAAAPVKGPPIAGGPGRHPSRPQTRVSSARLASL